MDVAEVEESLFAASDAKVLKLYVINMRKGI